MLDTYDAVALPVHDSFIVRMGYEPALKDIMNKALLDITGAPSKTTKKITVGESERKTSEEAFKEANEEFDLVEYVREYSIYLNTA